jgi:N-acetylmuramic acid 6-phosphate (MurNAc-6-P) etherase
MFARKDTEISVPSFTSTFKEVSYCMAGGDAALVKAVEGAEDSKKLAIEDLEAQIESGGLQRAVVVGITCGLSATYGST